MSYDSYHIIKQTTAASPPPLAGPRRQGCTLGLGAEAGEELGGGVLFGRGCLAAGLVLTGCLLSLWAKRQVNEKYRSKRVWRVCKRKWSAWMGLSCSRSGADRVSAESVGDKRGE